jgi:hypothetical protein
MRRARTIRLDEKYLAESKYYAKFEMNYAEGMKEDIDKNYAGRKERKNAEKKNNAELK